MPITRASITPFWKRGADAARAFLLMLCAVWASIAFAGSIEPVRGQLSPSEDGYVLSAEFAFDLGSRIEEAVTRGVALTFKLEVAVTRPRWYWFDEHVAGRVVSHRLSYSALTRQYRLSTGGLLRNFDSFEEVLRTLGRVGALTIADRGALRTGEKYDVELRLALDKSQLPKPLQVDAIANRDWQVDAKVLRWQYVPGSDGK